MSANSASADTGAILRRSLFFLVLILLTLGNLFTMFRGLNSPQAMDQAQIAREFARGNGLTTKMIRPVAYYQAEKSKGAVTFTAFGDTYHAPLNPFINGVVMKLVGADDPDAWKMGPNENVYALDRVVAAVSTLFFLMAIGVNYLLISRIFDAKIAGVCAVLMLFCETFWGYSLSGLPQMLLLLLFSCGAYFTYRAIEAGEEGRVAMTPALIAGVFFTLMALTHWLAVWIALGYIVFAAVAFRPRGIIGISVLVMLLAAAIVPMIRANDLSGSPLGTAYLVIYKGLGGAATEDAIMRTTDIQEVPFDIRDVIQKILRMTLGQATDIVPYLGGIIVAPLFFLSLLHPFKRMPIARLRWAILAMWVSAAFGMAIFGVSTKELDPNQLHLVFAPIMTAYGLAFLSILWSRLDLVASNPVLKNAHLVLVILICSAPLLLSLPRQIIIGINNRDQGGSSWWPTYLPQALNRSLKNWVKPDQICFSDQPWAVAWYADRMCVWLPTTKAGFEKIETAATNLGNPPAGILITPISWGQSDLYSISSRERDFKPLILDGNFLSMAPPGARASSFDFSPVTQNIAKKYPYKVPVNSWLTLFYSDRPLRREDDPNAR